MDHHQQRPALAPGSNTAITEQPYDNENHSDNTTTGSQPQQAPSLGTYPLERLHPTPLSSSSVTHPTCTNGEGNLRTSFNQITLPGSSMMHSHEHEAQTYAMRDGIPLGNFYPAAQPGRILINPSTTPRTNLLYPSAQRTPAVNLVKNNPSQEYTRTTAPRRASFFDIVLIKDVPPRPPEAFQNKHNPKTLISPLAPSGIPAPRDASALQVQQNFPVWFSAAPVAFPGSAAGAGGTWKRFAPMTSNKLASLPPLLPAPTAAEPQAGLAVASRQTGGARAPTWFSRMQRGLVLPGPVARDGVMKRRARVARGEDTRFRPWECNLCPSRFMVKGHLTQHVRYVHEQYRPHECPFPKCESRFGTVFARKQHVWTVHEKKKPFACDFPACGAKFGQRSHLNRHLKRHEARPLAAQADEL